MATASFGTGETARRGGALGAAPRTASPEASPASLETEPELAMEDPRAVASSFSAGGEGSADGSGGNELSVAVGIELTGTGAALRTAAPRSNGSLPSTDFAGRFRGEALSLFRPVFFLGRLPVMLGPIPIWAHRVKR